MVSNGCPASNRQAPPNPPATKFLRGETLSSLPIFCARHTASTVRTHRLSRHSVCETDDTLLSVLCLFVSPGTVLDFVLKELDGTISVPVRQTFRLLYGETPQ